MVTIDVITGITVKVVKDVNAVVTVIAVTLDVIVTGHLFYVGLTYSDPKPNLNVSLSTVLRVPLTLLLPGGNCCKVVGFVTLTFNLVERPHGSNLNMNISCHCKHTCK